MPSLTTMISLVVDAPRTLARRTSGAYRREIDGLRFFAIFIVLIGHLCERSQRFSGGTIASSDLISNIFFYIFQRPGTGVQLFFMISGFIIFSPAAGKPASAINRPFLANYFKRRILRIEPPYLLLLTLTYILIKTTGFTPPNTHRFFQAPASITLSYLVSLVYSHGWIFGTDPRLLPPGWSLEIEVQFYCLAPLLFYLYLQIRNATTRAASGVALLCASIVWSSFIDASPNFPHLNLTILADFPLFWAGILLKDFEGPVHDAVAGLPRLCRAGVGWMGLAILMTIGWFPWPLGLRQHSPYWPRRSRLRFDVPWHRGDRYSVQEVLLPRAGSA